MSPTQDEPRLLEAYRKNPMRNGDVALLTDLKLIQELEGLADDWDAGICRVLAQALREGGAGAVELAIARPDAELLPQDHALWADLREELLDTDITVWPLVPLPAAA